MRTHLSLAWAALMAFASALSAEPLYFFEVWEDDPAGAVPGSPWYADPHWPDGGLLVLAGTEFNHEFGGMKGLLVNSAGFMGKDAGVQARLVPAGKILEVTDGATLQFNYWTKGSYSPESDWYFELSLGGVHAPRVADVGLFNPLPEAIPVLAYCKPIPDLNDLSKTSYAFDGRQWRPVDFVASSGMWGQLPMILKAGVMTIPGEGDIARQYFGGFDRVSIYTRDYMFSGFTAIDDISLYGGNVIDALTVSPADRLAASGESGGPFDPPCKTYTLTNLGADPIDWTSSTSQDWLDVTPIGGTLAGGTAVDVAVCFSSQANALSNGVYDDQVVFTNTASGAAYTRDVQLQVGPADAFTELFAGNNDLDHWSLTFTPDYSPSRYSVCGTSATAFPTNLGGAVPVAVSGDNFVKIALAQGATVQLYGQAYPDFYVGANGYITFGGGDGDATPTLADHFAKPRISGLFADLNPAAGQVTWKQLIDRAVVTFQNVPLAGGSDSNSFQVEMFFDGKIRMTWLGIDATSGLAGLSRGMGVPAGYLPSDLTAYVICPAAPHPADLDADGDVDLSDAGHVQACQMT